MSNAVRSAIVLSIAGASAKDKAEKELAKLSPGDPVSGVTRVPFIEPQHPYSAQIMYVTKPPFPLPDDSPLKDHKYGFAMAGWGGRKFPRFEDAVTFDDNELDYRVPVAQGLQFYAALQGQGVPSRLVYFPDENHWILRPHNSVQWHESVNAWLQKYAGEK